MFWTALILGFAGSLHCLGMCSPLAMAVTNASPTAALTRLLYNLGRILTYATLGAIVGSVGIALPTSTYQNILSVVVGIVFIIVGLSGISAMKIPVFTTVLTKINFQLKGLFANTLNKRSFATSFLLGSLNGLLPCGLSFLALTYCLTLSGPIAGFAFMLLFGLGTLPVMLGFTTVFKWIVSRLHFSSHKLTTGLVILSGILLIARVFIVHISETRSFGETVVDIVVCK
jgi:uncharacterized protein